MMWFRRALPWLFALAIATNLFELASLTILPWNGVTGVEAVPTGRPFTYRVAALDASARAAGMRTGDLIDQRETLYGNHFANPVPGRPYVYVAHRGARRITVRVAPTQAPLAWDQIIRLIAVFWVLAFALLVLIKGAKSRENDYIALLLISLALESPSSRTALPDIRLLSTYTQLAVLSVVSMTLALTFYGTNIGTPVSRFRRALLGISVAIIAISAGWMAFGNVTNFYPLIDPYAGALRWPTWASIILPVLLSLSSIVAAIPCAPLKDRQRLAWVIAGFVPFLIALAAGNIAGGVGVLYPVLNVSMFFVPAALTYAALSRRLFDVGFVLNRAAVFTGVSAIVVGAFVLLEWALGQWFEGVNHATSLAINAALALVIGVSFRLIHGYVDRAVDTVFFRKRHDNETALRRFAREAAFFTSEDALLERTSASILGHSDVSAVSIVFASDLDPNDAAVVAMKAWHEPVDLHLYATSLEGEMAFPMIAHGTLAGAIVCGGKTTGERFAPDEIESLQTVAHGVGLALHALTRNAPEERSLSRLECRMDAMADAIAQMPAAIARELRVPSME